MGIEQRVHARARPHPHHPVVVQIIGRDFLDELQALDISVGGLAVRVPHRFDGCEIDREVRLIVSVPGLRPFEASGTIRHIRDDATGAVFGLRFASIAAACVAHIAAYVAERLRVAVPGGGAGKIKR